MRATEPTTVPASGVGSLPHHDPLEACAMVLDALPDLPHLPELPGRGRGADTIGRAGAVLVDLPVETVADGWQVAARPGADLRRAQELLSADLTAVSVAAQGFVGPLKVQVCGPLTLAAALGRPRGEAAVSDRALRRDLAVSLAEGVARHVADVAARVPGADLVLQLDEPLLPNVLGGRLRTRSGAGRIAPVEPAEAEDALALVLDAYDGETVVHCCAPDVPFRLLADAGVDGIGFDLAQVTDTHLDEIGGVVDRGRRLWVGAVPTAGGETGRRVTRRVSDLWARLGFTGDVVRGRTVVTPACGLAGATPEGARAAYRSARDAAARLTDADADLPAG